VLNLSSVSRTLVLSVPEDFKRAPLCIFSDRQLSHENCGVEAGSGAAGCELCGLVLGGDQRGTASSRL